MDKCDILFGKVNFKNLIILQSVLCVFIMTQMGITLMIMKLNLIKSDVNSSLDEIEL